MSIKLFYDCVVVKLIEVDEIFVGGIVIFDFVKEKFIKGEVVVVGLGKLLDNGSVCVLLLKVGDKVIYGQYVGSSYKFEGVEFKVLCEDDIFVIVG